jgi:2-keto-3-deoxy-L-rhamnonate aldolase RhmA
VVGLRNKVKQKLSEGGTAVGAWMGVLNEDVASAMGSSGLDWVLYDLEHESASIEW